MSTEALFEYSHLSRGVWWFVVPEKTVIENAGGLLFSTQTEAESKGRKNPD